MKTWTFYSLTDGAILGQRLSSDDHGMVERNTPDGCGAIEGEYDRLSQRVDLKALEVVDWVPPQPDADHEFLPNQFGDRPRWAKKAAAVEREQKDASARAALVELDQRSVRRLRELSSDPQLVAIEAEAVEVRKDLATDIASDSPSNPVVVESAK